MASPPVPTTADEFIEQQLNSRLADLEAAFDSDALCLVGALIDGVDGLVRTLIEERRQQADSRPRLVILLTTNGGYVGPVQRIVGTLRYHYDHVAFVIPNYAFSAGTILALSGDEIHMDYYSRLGPIDPQISSSSGRSVPALGYLIQWERLLKKAADGTITLAEIQLMIEGFDQAELYYFEQARELSIELLKEWLVKYKFKNWTHTETSGTAVTPEQREKRAVEIAEQLNDTDRWHSHGYGLSMEVLQRVLRLRIDDFDKDSDRCGKIRQYDGLLSDFMGKLGHQGALHTVGKYLPFM